MSDSVPDAAHSTPAGPAITTRLSWAETRELMRQDHARYAPFMGEDASLSKRIFWILLPGSLGLASYRLYRYMHLRGWRAAANLMFLVNRYVTGIDIPPASAIGGGCLLGHGAVVLCGRIGSGFTMMGHGGIGGGFDSADVGAGPGLPAGGIVAAAPSRVMRRGDADPRRGEPA